MNTFLNPHQEKGSRRTFPAQITFNVNKHRRRLQKNHQPVQYPINKAKAIKNTDTNPQHPVLKKM